MSQQDYHHHHHHQGVFTFSSNGFERSNTTATTTTDDNHHHQQHHIAQQLRRDKLRVQTTFDHHPPPPLVGIEEDDESSAAAGIPGYESSAAAGNMLSEMFNFPLGGSVVPGTTATELLENQILQSYRNNHHSNSRGVGSSGGLSADWFQNLGNSKNQITNDAAVHHQHQLSSINAESAAAMQLFLINPHQQQQQQQQRSPPSPSPSQPPNSTSSTLHMLLPNPSSSLTNPAANGPGFGQFTWSSNPSDIPPAGGGVVEGQGLSLSLSSSLEAAKQADELRMGDGGMLFFGGGAGSTPTPTPSAAAQYQHQHPHQFKSLGGLNLSSNHHQFGSSSFGTVNLLRNSKYAKAAQELLEEFCSVGRGQFKRNKITKNDNNNGNPSSNPNGGGNGNSSTTSSKEVPPLSAADRIEHQRRKVKLLSMLEEVDRRYNHYCKQMQMVVNSFDMVMGFGAAVPYTCLAQKAMSRHFRCLKDAIAEQLKHSCEVLGEKDVGSSGVTKGETPRLKMLEQSLRQQRAFHQMGMMEQEAWRPQRGLPERSVNILRAWLFEHFLHPYPSDADKHLLARQTGLSRNQVSNWFINARVRLWKPMIEEMYQQESKDQAGPGGDDQDPDHSSTSAQTPTPPAGNSIVAASSVSATATSSEQPPTIINAPPDNNDHSFTAINNKAPNLLHNSVAGAGGASVQTMLMNNAAAAAAGQLSIPEQAGDVELESSSSTVIRFGTSGGDVSLTLGLRHAGNVPEKNPFSVREFGGC